MKFADDDDDDTDRQTDSFCQTTLLARPAKSNDGITLIRLRYF